MKSTFLHVFAYTDGVILPNPFMGREHLGHGGRQDRSENGFSDANSGC
ncbi:MAG: hypothetical protein JWR21_3684 [Herminiimonas sp.]|nr:hypothetical protein [Herminiimonas sp.]